MRTILTLLLAMLAAGLSMLVITACQAPAAHVPAPVHTNTTRVSTNLGQL